MALQDGDIVMTGTAQGVGQVQTGDSFIGRVKPGHQVLVSQEWQVE